MSRSQTFIVLFAVFTAILTAWLMWPEGSVRDSLRVFSFKSQNNKSSQKMLVFGLDGMPADLFKNLGTSDEYPNLQRLLHNGSFLRINPSHNTSAEIWTTYFTGRPPKEHGLTGFYKADGYQLRLHNRTDLKVPFLWDRLIQKGFTVGVNGFFGLWPVKPQPGSFIISLRALNYDELVRSTFAHRASDGYSFVTDQTPNLPFTIRRPGQSVFPSELLGFYNTPCSTDDMNHWFKETGFDLLVSTLQDSFRKQKGGFAERTKGKESAKSKSNVREMTKSLCLLIRNEQWLKHSVMRDVRPDFFATYFLGMDFVIHRVFDFAPRFHRSEARFILSRGERGRGLLTSEVMRYVDQWVGLMIEELQEGSTLVLLSDHGFHPVAVSRLKSGSLTARPSDADGFILVVGPGRVKDILKKVQDRNQSEAEKEYLAPVDVYQFFRHHYGLAE